MGQYISIHDGAEIDRVISLFKAGETSKRSIYSHAITAEGWAGTSAPYTCSITLNGVYDIGQYPIVYFVDSTNVKYDLDYTFTSTLNANAQSVATSVTVYTNKKAAGNIIEVASLSGSNV